MKHAIATAVLALRPLLQGAAAPRTPASGNEVITELPRQDDGLRALRAEVAAAPRDPVPALALARRYVMLGRASADPRYYGQAQAVLAPWWDRPDAPNAVRLLRATLLQNGHHFTEAERVLGQVVADDPRAAQAWLTLATVQAVQGDTAGAIASCGRLSSLTGQLETFACLAVAGANTGRMRGAEQLLAIGLEREGEGNAAPEIRTWALTMLAELAARRGDAAVAQRRFVEALRGAPADSYLLGAYADFLLDQGRAADVPALLKAHHRNDGLLLRHALALGALGRREALAPVRAELQARFDAAALRGDAVHLREQARFTLHVRGEARAALALALRNWQVQKELADTRILLEAGLAARDRAALQPVLRWIRAQGLQDVVVARLTGKAS
jgi:tetratricopeptide (TPR) repeat protein